MATLRDNLFARPTVSTTELDRPYIEGMSSLRRGWEAGRIGTEANSLGAEWANANAAGDTARAASLREQADALQARRNIYSPEVNRVEDVKGVDSLMGYVGGQVGQGAASMVDPVLASTGVAAVGTGLRFSSNPIAKAVGAGLQTLGAPAAAYAINQNQLKGEFANDAYQDKELMARTSAKDFNDTASMYGYAAGALDTVLPAMVGRTLGGAGLRMGAKEAAGTFGGRLVRNMGLEGATELGQDVGSKATQGYLNPNRDTSEDASSYLNSFVGGAIGAGPFAAAEALGASGTQRINGVAGAVKDTAGSVVDMARPYAEAGMDKAGEVAGKVRDKVIDLATGEDGTQSVTALKDNLKAASQELKSKWQATQEERDLIMGNPPAELQGSQDPNAWQLWQEQNEPKRMQAIVDRLDAMGQSGDQTAVDLVGRIMSDDPVAQQTAVEEAADYIVGQSEIAQLEKQAGRFGEAASKGGKLIGKAAMWAARKGFDAAKGFGQAVWDGAKEGSKKNAQAAGNADRMAEYLSATSQRKGPIAELMRDMGYEIAEMADLAEVNPSTAAPDLRRNLNNSTFSLGVNRIVNSLRVAYGAQAEQVVGNLRQMAAPSAAPVFDAMAQELTAQRADKSGAHTAQIRSTAAAELMGAVDAETETKLLKEGINLRAPESQRQLLGMVEAVSLGRAAPQARKALEKLVGRDTLNRMLAVVAPQTEQDGDESHVNDGEVMEEGFTVDEDGEVVENSSSAYDQEAALKTFAKGEGSKVYGFFGTGNRTDLDSRDPFAADVKGMTREQYKQFQQENINRQAMGEDPLPDPRRRPRLFTKGQTLSEKAGGGIAIDKRVADLEKYLQVDRTPERMAALMEQEGNKAGAEKVRALITRGDESAQATLDSAMKSFFVNRAGGWRVGAKPAWDVLQGQNAQPTKVLSLYRDYLRQDGDTERAELANQVLLDEMDQSKGSRANFRVQAGARKKVKADAEAYFRERELAVAERLSDRDNMKLDETELLSLHDSGFKVVNRARSLEGQGNKQIAAANILTFKSALSPNGGLLHVKVSDLVRLVQQRRNERTANDFEDTSGYFGNGNKNRTYLDLVLEGVGMIMDTGRVEGWPYKLNEKNGKEYFGEGKNGVPDSLMLATTTNGGMLYGKEQNAAGKAGEKIAPIAGPRDPRSVEDARTDEYQEKVARDQNDRADFFSPDSRQEQEPSGYKLSTKAPRGKQIHLPTVAVFDDLDSKRGLQRNAGFQGLQTANRTDVKPHEAKTTDLKMTPLDVATKPKGGRAVTGAPDDFADQRARSISQGYTADSGTKQGQTYPKAKMESRGTALGQQLGQLLSTDFDAGMAEVDQWLRMAQAPTYAKEGATGGAHLAMPVAVALSADNLGMVDAGPKDHERLQAARAQVLRIVADSDLAQKDKLKVAKALVAADVREKLTVMNLDKFLDRNAAPAKEAGAPVGKSQSAPSGSRNAQNDQPGSAPKSTWQERSQALTYIRNALGNKVKVEFADITGYSGEFIDADDLIRISTTPAAGTLQTAYHETLHAFFKQFVRSNPLAMDVIKALAEHKPTLERVHALLDGYPEAQAALANGEERLAYMYQFWAADLLDLPYGKPRTLFQKLLKFFRRVLGQVSDLERSADLLMALHTGQLGGDPSVAGKVVAKALNQGTWTKKQLRKMDGLVQMIAAGVLPANDVLRNSDSMTSKKLGVTFWTNPGEGSDGSAQEGYLNARHRMAARYVNEFSLFISDLNDRDLKAMTTALQAENDDLDSIAHAPTREAAKRTRALIQRFRKYMVEEKGLQLGDRGPNYFPRVWDTEALMANQTEFLTLLTTKYGSMLHGNNDQEKQKSAMRLFNALITNNMVDGKMPAQREDGVLTPFFAQGQGRDMAWLDGADIAKFQSKDAIKTLTTYFHAGARAAEYAARFGQKGEKLSAALNNVEIELMEAAAKRERRGEFKDAEARNKWVARQMRDVNQAVEAMEGSIGQNSEGTAMRKFGSAMTVYQNVRLLPLAIFSQVVDPLGMLARGATMKQAYESFLRGMKEVGQSWADMFREVPKERRPDQWEKLAMAVGSVDAAMFSHHVSEEYSSTYMSPTARKINDKFFRLNGMEAWNRGMRVGATKAAVQFLEHHKRTPSEHSIRWLKELGLAPKDLIVDSDGALLTDWRSIKTATGMNEEQARAHTDRIHYAINHWVQGAVLTPNAAQRPAWSSDPSYSMFFHLKQFSYSFHKTILHRAVKELEYGNLAPLGSFAWYIPAMIAADVTKGLMLNGGELPQHLKGMDLGEWVMHGLDRSGALGIGNIGVDAAGDLASMGGPAVEQIIDGFRDDMGATTLNALPAHGLFKALVN